MTKFTIVASTTPRRNQGAKVKVVTDVVIKLVDGDKLPRTLAVKTFGGKYNPSQALKEFKKNPSIFTPRNAYTPEQLKFFASAA